jgi:predicted DNA-binding transcriptional regulator AlpA
VILEHLKCARNAMASAKKLVRMERQAPAVSPRLLTAEDVAEVTGLSVETLAQWRSQRRGIPFLKISRNVVRYRQNDLDAWLSERIVRVEQDPSNARSTP